MRCDAEANTIGDVIEAQTLYEETSHQQVREEGPMQTSQLSNIETGW